jgi:predicted GH43/DUF377 family glycosyl hydrolase
MPNKRPLSKPPEVLVFVFVAVCLWLLLLLVQLLQKKNALVLGQGQHPGLDKAMTITSTITNTRSSSGSEDDFPNCTDLPPRQGMYDVIVTELDAIGNHDGASLISHANGSSDFEYNFNSAWFPSSQQGLPEGLMVRLVDLVQHPEWANAGALAVVPVKLDPNSKPLLAQHVTQNMVTWAGAKDGPSIVGKEVWGAVDPRIVYRPKTQQYYLTWDNCTKNCWPQRITYLSTTSNPYDPHAWTLHGPVFPFPYTSGAALLFRDDPGDSHPHNPHLAFVCNSNTADAILIAESYDTWNWSIPEDPARRILMKGRPGCWDATGIAAGPQPERISQTGDYLLIYNIDTGYPYHPNPLGRCAIGWAILDGEDPTKIVARSRKPLLIATRPWETCPQHQGHNDPNCQVPMVVFASGLKPLPNNEFYVVYGGADTVVGISKIKVTIRKSQRNRQGSKSPFIHVEEASH